MRNYYRKFSRQFHLWAALVIFLPVIIVVTSGVLLQVKKEFTWIQPSTMKGSQGSPSLDFEDILVIAKTVPQAQINTWNDIDRLDVRPSKGVIKIQAQNAWEIQIDGATGDILQTAYRRSDTIEQIHDGSWFFEGAKLWVFLPSAIVLWLIWATGLVLLYTTLKSKYKKNHHQNRR